MGVLAIGASLGIALYVFRKWKQHKWGWCRCDADMEGKVVVITGANCGIGLETARGLAAKGATVILACREVSKAQEAISNIRRTVSVGHLVFFELDLASNESIRLFVSRLLTKYKKIDVLINNAGVYYLNKETTPVNDQGMELHFAVNHLGHFLLTHLLTDTITATPQSRIIIVSSELYKTGQLSFDDHSSAVGRGGRNPLYCNSKLANLLHARELNNRLKGRGVAVCALSPGFVKTKLFRHSMSGFNWLKKLAFLPIAFLYMRSTAQGAQTSIHCACSSKIQPSESLQYFQNCALATLEPVATNDESARMLWQRSMQLLKLQ